MKPYFLLLLLLVTLPASAQWITSGNHTIHINTGFVGIGTASPGTPLDINGETRAAAFRVAGGLGDNVNGAPWYGLGVLNNNTNIVQLAGFPGIRFTTGGGQIMINSDGYLGVGTITPDQRLVVNGNIKSILDQNYPAKNVVTLVGLGTSGITGAQNWAIRGVYQHGNGVSLNANGGDLDIIKSFNGNTVLATKTDGSPLGNVAIGTTNPHGYRLAVGGDMIAESVTVKLQGQWPDFVFAQGYKLLPLESLQRYIRSTQHLPGLPAAKALAENGVNLGEMVRLQTKKIEELTLYLLQEHKKNADLAHRLAKLERTMKARSHHSSIKH
ncbi:hypothetical protein [Mucilaginibacter sp. PAMB04168]|uniref:hypothetical protein n=1 Tax=Mucilaginibacter sp. PAMB04168 TaxID=3138567 RepID=UPI0031F65811